MRSKYSPKSKILTEFEEDALVKYLLDKDDRGFGLNQASVENMADLLESRGASRVGVL